MERDEVEMESVECFFKKFVCEVFWGLNTRSLFLVGGKIALFFFFFNLGKYLTLRVRLRIVEMKETVKGG